MKVLREKNDIADMPTLDTKTVENDLLQSEMKYRSVFENTGTAMIIIEEDNTISLANAEAEKISGYSRKEIEGRMRWPEFVMQEDIAKMQYYHGLRRSDPESAPRRYEFRLIDKYGNIKQIAMTVALIPGTRRSIASIIDITERKKMEAELQESERKYRELVQNANSIILRWNAEGEITFMNEFGQSFFGYTEREIIGRHVVGTIVPETESTGRDLRPLMDQISADPKAFERNVNENMQRDGSRVWVAWTNKAVFDPQGKIIEVFSVGTDITDRKKAEEEAKLSATRIHYLSKYANDFIILLDDAFRFLEVNERTIDFYGYTREELIGMHASQLRSPEARENFIEQIDLVQVSGKVLYETMHRRKDGRTFPVEVSLRAIDSEGKRFYQAVIRDITKRKEAEDELTRYREHLEELVTERTRQLEILNKELEQSNIKLQELDRLKSMFIASMSHELRTPLNSIIGFTGMTLQGLSGELNDEQKDNLSRVYQASKHLLSLITDVIDISKIEAGRIDTFLEMVSIKNIIAEAIAAVEPQLNEKRLTLSVDKAVDVELNTDRKRLLQCLINLLSNAVKFTEKGGISVTVHVHDSNVEISVTDTGIGIAEKDMPKLFEAFERLETHLRVKAGGTGLGLYLTKKLIEDILKGSVSVNSLEGQGSTFTLRVPMDLHQTLPVEKGVSR